MWGIFFISAAIQSVHRLPILLNSTFQFPDWQANKRFFYPNF